MSADGDDVQRYALGAVAVVVLGVLIGVIAIGVTGWPHAADPRTQVVDVGAHLVWFGPDAESLTPQASETLAAVAEAVRGNPLATVQITGVRDVGEMPDEARRRADRVRHALESNGISADRLTLGDAVVAVPGQSASAARRVELTVQ